MTLQIIANLRYRHQLGHLRSTKLVTQLLDGRVSDTPQKRFDLVFL